MLDSHSHIYSHEFDDDRDLVIARAREVGVRHIVLPNENRESVPRLVATRLPCVPCSTSTSPWRWAR